MWLDDIQRVVCGVSDTTTCRDIVYALAHATGRTGRFTLVERWRSNERLLAPQERPAKVLSKWGEYSGEVQFVLLRSPLADKSPSGRRLARHRLGSVRPLSPEPGACQDRQLSPLQLSVAPSVGGMGAARLASHVLRGTVGVVRGIPQQQEQQQQQHSAAATQSLPFVGGVSVPLKCSPPSCLNESASSAASVSLSSQDGVARTSTNSSLTSSRRYDTPPPYRDPPPPPSPHSPPPLAAVHCRPPLPPPYRLPPSAKHNTSRSSLSPSRSVTGEGSCASGSANGADSWSHDHEHAQLVAMVRSQKRQLLQLQTDVDKVDVEADLLTKMQQEYDVQIKALQTETTQLESVLLQRQTELCSVEADEEAWKRELQINQQSQLELDSLKNKLDQCSQQLEQANSKLTELNESLPEERKLSEDHHSVVCGQLLELAQQLRQLQLLQSSLAEQRAAGQLQLQQLDQLMGQRQQQLKQLNMEALSLTTSSSQTDSSATEAGGKHSGVSRQLVGSARQLELAAPTARNPLGIWV